MLTWHDFIVKRSYQNDTTLVQNIFKLKMCKGDTT